jgi:hypothetical protein
VLPTLTKLIEKHVSKHIYQYLIKFDLLHPTQSGFRPNHSCQTALINIIDKWLQEMINGKINLAVLLDLKKTFDVPIIIHFVLLELLNMQLSSHHFSTQYKTSCTFTCSSWIFVPDVCIVESSAYMSV